MRKAVASFLFVVAVLAVPALASAQHVRVWVGPYYPIAPLPPPVIVPVPAPVPAPVYVPPPVPVTYRRAPAYYAPVVPVPLQLQRRWALGLNYAITSVNQTVAGDTNVMSGGTLFARYRMSPHWGFELGFQGAGGSFGQDDRFKRGSFIPTASMTLHLIPRGMFDLFLIGGIGGVFSSVEIENPPGHPNLAVGKQSFGEFQGHLGVGAELRLGRVFGITGDVRYVGRVLDTSSGDGRFYKDVDDGPVPKTSHGVQGQLGIALHF